MRHSMHLMLTKVGSFDLLSNKEYIFEPKLDGVRALCFVGRALEFVSRNNLDLTDTYPELTIRKNIKATAAVLDGEIIAYDKKGYPNFELLQQGYQATYVVFDILELNGKSLIALPLLQRKKILQKVVQESDRIEIIPFTNDGKKLWNEIKKRRLEGVMAKRKDSVYHPGKRTKDWLKIKLLNTIDCIIVGYLPKKRVIGSLAIAVYDRGKLRYIGNVGTGYTEQRIKELYAALHPLRTDGTAVFNIDDAPKDLVWVKPKLVCEVEYLMLSRYKILRAPSFLRLRDDKKPKQCTLSSQIRRMPKQKREREKVF